MNYTQIKKIYRFINIKLMPNSNSSSREAKLNRVQKKISFELNIKSARITLPD